MKAIVTGVALGLMSLALGACASSPGPIGGAAGLQVIEGDLPPPTAADLYAGSEFSGIRPFDTLTIDVFGVEELSNRRVRVDGNGEIAFPLIGNITVSGLSTGEISRMIETRLRGQYVRDPQVTTNLVSSENRSFTVYGEVRQPGVYPLVGEASLIRAVATARGLAKYGDGRDVIVFRTVGGDRLATLYNLDAISRGAYDDPRIYPGDTVVVGDSASRRLFDDFVGIATILAAPVTILLNR